MTYAVNITKQAEADLAGIYNYIAFELNAPQSAEGQLNRLEKCILSLDNMPERFRLYAGEPWKSRGLRIVAVDNYCILYIPDNNSSTVTIIRVLYGGCDIDKHLDNCI